MFARSFLAGPFYRQRCLAYLFALLTPVLTPVFGVCSGQTLFPPDTMGAKAVAALNASRFDQAEALFRSAIAVVDDPSSAESAILWDRLGQTLEAQGRFDEAKPAFERAKQINDALAIPRPLPGAGILVDLGSVAEYRSDYVTAERNFRDALAIYERNNALGRIDAGVALANLGMALVRLGRYAEAREVFGRSKDTLLKTAGDQSQEYAQLLVDSALLNFEIGDFSAASIQGKLALQILRSLAAVPPENMATDLNNLGQALLAMGHIAEAEPLLTEAISIERANGARLRKQLADSLNNLAMLEKASGRIGIALRHEQEALQLNEIGSEHCGPSAVLICNNLGAIELAQNHFGEARALFDAAAAALQQTHPSNESMYAAVLSNLASLESKLGHHKKAERLFSRALEMDLGRFPEVHPRIATDRNNLGTELFYLKKQDEAIEQLARAAQAFEKSLGTSHPEVAKTLKNLGLAYQAAQQFDLAQDTLQQALHVAENAEGPDGAQLPPILFAYASVLRHVHRFSEAEQAEVRAVGIQVRIAVQENRKS